MTKPFISIVLIVTKAKCSAATYNTNIVLISNRMGDEGTEKDS